MKIFKGVIITIFFLSLMYPVGNCMALIDTMQTKPVSMIRLIANPEKFEGKKVLIVGYVVVGFESNAIYLSKEDFENGLVPNSLALPYDEIVKEKFSNKYCIIEGEYDSEFTGHLGANVSGGIKNISRFEVYHPPTKTPKNKDQE